MTYYVCDNLGGCDHMYTGEINGVKYDLCRIKGKGEYDNIYFLNGICSSLFIKKVNEEIE